MDLEKTATEWCEILGIPQHRETLLEGLKKVYETGQKSVLHMSRVEREELAAIENLLGDL